MQYPVETLDARNVGSSTGLNMGDGETVFGTIAAITRDALNREVVIELDTVEESVTLPFGYKLDVQLKADALYALHAKNTLCDMLEFVKGMGTVLEQLAELQGVRVEIPTLRAV